MTTALVFLIGIAALICVGIRICVVVRRELTDDLERRRVVGSVAVARMRLRRLHQDAQRQMQDVTEPYFDVGAEER